MAYFYFIKRQIVFFDTRKKANRQFFNKKLAFIFALK